VGAKLGRKYTGGVDHKIKSMQTLQEIILLMPNRQKLTDVLCQNILDRYEQLRDKDFKTIFNIDKQLIQAEQENYNFPIYMNLVSRLECNSSNQYFINGVIVVSNFDTQNSTNVPSEDSIDEFLSSNLSSKQKEILEFFKKISTNAHDFYRAGMYTF
jgi:hypothetical protein